MMIEIGPELARAIGYVAWIGVVFGIAWALRGLFRNGRRGE